MTVEVCLLRAGTTSAALLDMIVDMVVVMVVVYQWERWNDVGGGGSIPRGVALIARVEGATDKALRNTCTNLESNAHVIVLITAQVDI
jgi:hypothetical protein